LQQQKDAIIKKIHSVINRRVYPGLKFDEEDGGKRCYSFDEIPGLKEAGWTLRTYE